MLDPNKVYDFLWDKATRQPACPIIQVMYGGDREPCYVFRDWQINLVDSFVRIRATGEKIMKYAKELDDDTQTNNRKA